MAEFQELLERVFKNWKGGGLAGTRWSRTDGRDELGKRSRWEPMRNLRGFLDFFCFVLFLGRL